MIEILALVQIVGSFIALVLAAVREEVRVFLLSMLWCDSVVIPLCGRVLGWW